MADGTTLPGSSTANGPHDGVLADLGVAPDGLLDGRPRADDAVDQPGVGAELGARTHHAPALQQRAGEQGHVGRQLDGGVDVGALGIEHGDPEAQPALVGAAPQLGLGPGELHPVVDALGLGRVVRHHALDPVAGVVQHPDDVGQVVLALGVLGAEPAQGGGEHAAAEAVDRRVDLVDGALVLGGVGLLDHPVHPVVGAADDAAVAGRVVEPGGQHGAGRLGPRWAATSAATVAGRSSGVSPGSTRTSPSSSSRSSSPNTVSPTLHRVAGAALHVLLDEVEVQVGRLLLQLLRDPLGAVADDDHGPAGIAVGQRVEHVEEHGPAAQQVQRLGPGRAHAHALTGGQHDGGQRAGAHLPVLTRPVGSGYPSGVM